MIIGAITPCGQCFYCLSGAHSQFGGGIGGCRFGNTINGAWAEYLLVPDARANLAPIPDDLSDEAVVLCPDIFSTGLSGAESGNIRVGDAVAVFAQGPIGLCATIGAKLKGASLIIGIDSNAERLAVARRLGANITLNTKGGGCVVAGALLSRTATAALYTAMRQPPETFGAVMSYVPAMAMIALPFKPLWMSARRGHLQIGDLAPDFSLPVLHSETIVILSKEYRQKPVVLVFGSYT